MKFNEVKMATHACDCEGKAILLFPRTAKVRGKGKCPHNRLRCCFFCEIEDCQERCELVKLLPHQSLRIFENQNCPRLISNEKVAWKYLLGNNVPELG